MAILINGSLCLTDLIEKCKAGHSAFKKSEKNGKIYVSYTEWVNDEANEHGQHSSLLLNSTKEMKEAEGKVYFGNGKRAENKGAAINASELDLSGAPVAGSAPAVHVDDLPF